MREALAKIYPTLGCCGIDCGLCPRYYTDGPSRCPGCAGQGFCRKHPSCGILSCCVGQKGLEACSQCKEWPCARLKDWDACDSFVSHHKCRANLGAIAAEGLAAFLLKQRKRIALLQGMLKEFDDGRSKGFYCLAAALLPLPALAESLCRAREWLQDHPEEDAATKAPFLRDLLNNFAKRERIQLTLRHKNTEKAKA